MGELTKLEVHLLDRVEQVAELVDSASAFGSAHSKEDITSVEARERIIELTEGIDADSADTRVELLAMNINEICELAKGDGRLTEIGQIAKNYENRRDVWAHPLQNERGDWYCTECEEYFPPKEYRLEHV